MKNYKLNNDDILFISEQMVRLHESGKPFDVDEVARELMASIICCSVKNGG